MSRSSTCRDCGSLKSKLKEHLQAFSVVSRFCPGLDSSIIVKHIEKLLGVGGNEEDDDVTIINPEDDVESNVAHLQLFNAFKILQSVNPSLDPSIFFKSFGTLVQKEKENGKSKRKHSSPSESSGSDLEIVEEVRPKRLRAIEGPNPLSVLPPPDDSFLATLPFIPWGNKVTGRTLFKYTNTCTIDNGLMTLTLLFKFFPFIVQYFEEESNSPDSPGAEVASAILSLVQIIESKKDYNAAKTIWIKKVCKDETRNLVEAASFSFTSRDGKSDHLNCLWGSEEDLILFPLKKLMEKYVEVQECPNPEHGVILKEVMSLASFQKGRMNDIVQLINLHIQSPYLKCTRDNCSRQIIRKVAAMENCQPCPFLVFHVHDESDVNTIPKVIQVLGTSYQLFSASMYDDSRRHFFAAFDWNGVWITYDGLRDSFYKGLLTFDYISLLWYIRK